MFKGGYFHKILHVDLSAGSSSTIEIDDAFCEKYIGGRAFGAKLLWDRVMTNGKVDPLGPDNPIIIAPGPLSGTYVPSGGKTSIISLSPATRSYGDSNFGGSFGVEVRQAGYDALMVTGRAEELSYIWIDGDNIKIVKAPKLAGKGCLETEGMIKEEIGDHSVRIAITGPAGEKLVRFACINSDWSRNAGRTGMGAVMGSKNLKAIAVRGGVDLPVADLARLQKVTDKAFDILSSHDLFRFWQANGLMSVIDYANSMGILPTHNFKNTTFAKASSINHDVMRTRYKIGDSACFGCSMCCGNICLVKEGKYAGTVTEGTEYESAAMLGPNVGVDNFSTVLRANYLCDELGIDTISTGNLIGLIIEGYESGLLKLADIDNVPIDWGDDDAIINLIEKIARREGIGDTLAGATPAVLERWPQLAPIASHTKGLEQSAYDCRGAISMALAYGTSDIGAHHARAWTVAREIEMGAKWPLEKKADLVIYHQTLRPLFDMLGVCRLPWIELGLDENLYAEMYSAVTGVDVTLEQLLEKSAAIYDMTRLINVRYGIDRKDDYPSTRVFDDPVQTGPRAGSHVDRQEYEKLLDIYYQKRGWDADGKPDPKKAESFS